MKAFRNLFLHAFGIAAGYLTRRVTKVLLIVIYISWFGYFFQHLFPYRVSFLPSLSNSNPGISDAAFPLCSRDILNKSSYEYSFDSLTRNVAMKPVHQDPPCRLTHYSKSETVQCFDTILDSLRLKKEAGKLADGDTGDLRVVFAGDSRIRQIYYEHVKVLPYVKEQFGVHHTDMMNNVSIFDDRVKFEMMWKPRMKKDIQKILSDWADSNTTIPHFILLGFASHYFKPDSDKENCMEYERQLKEMYPILERLGKRMRERSNGKIVWMMQYHYYDRNFNAVYPIDDSNNKFHTSTVEHFNSIARRILRNSSVVQVWDSLLPIADEYYRGCVNNFRVSPTWLRTWKDCNDMLHAGFQATTQGFQFLLNELCNTVMMNE